MRDGDWKRNKRGDFQSNSKQSNTNGEMEKVMWKIYHQKKSLENYSFLEVNVVTNY